MIRVEAVWLCKVAMSHGINANVVHRWRQLEREGRGVAVPTLALPANEFVPVALASPPTASRNIRENQVTQNGS